MIDKYNISSPGGGENDNVVVNRSMSEFQFRNRPFACPSGKEIYRPTSTSGGSSSGSKNNIDGFSCLKYRQNPTRKRTKLIKVDGNYGVRSADSVAKPSYGKKPDPNAPKITKPCSECGKKFWSWKALFGHMRCHPERQWRGINPPPSFKHHHYHYQQQQPSVMSDTKTWPDSEIRITAEDHELATCLLMLANGPSCSDDSPTVSTTCNITSQETSSIVVRDPLMLTCRRYVVDHADITASSAGNCSRFECSSCKKVFGSHQALGGHRASHKNVKGCYAKNEDEEEEQVLLMGNDCEVDTMNKDAGDDNNESMNSNIHTFNGHKCSICLRVFSSGQALGGHKRCHWEKADDPLMGITTPIVNPFAPNEESWGLDLNLPPTIVRDDSLHSSAIALDLKLGL